MKKDSHVLYTYHNSYVDLNSPYFKSHIPYFTRRGMIKCVVLDNLSRKEKLSIEKKIYQVSN